jgi:hypothetical protein
MSHTLRVRCVSVGRLDDAEYGSFAISEGRISVADEATARALADRHTRVERIADDPTDEPPDVCGAQLNSGGTCDRPADSCPYHDASDR